MNLSLSDLKELVCGCKEHATTSLRIGEQYLIRTVTHYFTGRVVAITDSDIVLEDGAWIADTGRFADARSSGSLNEVEPYPGQAIIFRSAMIDAAVWPHKLPRDQK